MIKHVDVFKTLADEDVEKLVSGATEKVINQGEYIFRRGDESAALYIIRRGRIEIVRDGDKLAELADGDMFGEMGVLDEKPRGADIIAAVPTILIAISKELLWSVIGGRMSVEMKIRHKILSRHTANISHTFSRKD